MNKMTKNSSKKIKYLTILSVLIVLSFLLGQIKIFQLPAGGSITAFSLLPIAFAGYCFGTGPGVLTGIIVGFLNLLFGGYIIHPVQMIIDYPLAYGAVGLAGIMSKKPYGLLKGYLVGLFFRFLCTFISGLIFFSSYAPENFDAFSWSLCYNLIYNSVEGAVTVILIVVTQKHFLGIKNKILEN